MAAHGFSRDEAALCHFPLEPLSTNLEVVDVDIDPPLCAPCTSLLWCQTVSSRSWSLVQPYASSCLSFRCVYSLVYT